MDVEPIRAGPRQFFSEIRHLVIDDSAETRFVLNVRKLFRTGRDADSLNAACPRICPTKEPTAPLAAATTTVSPGFGRPMSREPGSAVKPIIPRTPIAVDGGAMFGSIRRRPPPSDTAKRRKPEEEFGFAVHARS